VSILFLVDENLPIRSFRGIVAGRGHRTVPVAVAERDPAILIHAAQIHAVIVTADTWFYNTVKREMDARSGRYASVGVVEVPGDSWVVARHLLRRHLAVIEAHHDACRAAGYHFLIRMRAGGVHLPTDAATVAGSLAAQAVSASRQRASAKRRNTS
jgi:hypothetical protein